MKAIGWIIGIVVILLVGAGVFIVLNSGGLVKSAIEEFGPQYLGVDVGVREVNLDLTAGSAQVKGLSMGNPQGFSGADMMSLEEIKVVLDTSQISDTLVVMKQVLIDGAAVNAIANGQRTNFQQMMDNLGVSSSSDDAAAQQDGAAEMKFIVDRFDFTNATASLSSDILGDLALNIPDIHLKDVGRKTNGATAAELAQQLFEPISAAISREAVNQGLDIDGVKANVRQKIEEKIGSGLKGLTDRLKRD